MINTEEVNYKSRLEIYGQKGNVPGYVAILDRPANSDEVILFNKWCLKTYLDRFYQSIDEAPLLVLRSEVLKDMFLKEYYITPDKESYLFAAKKDAREQIRIMSGGNYCYAAKLYSLIKAGMEEKLFVEKFGGDHYKVYKQYALIYDLVKYKIFLDDMYNRLSLVYGYLNFNLNKAQMYSLWKCLQGQYICDSTKLEDFMAVFSLSVVEGSKRIKWVHKASRNKNQTNRSTLFSLVLALAEIKVIKGRQLNPEVFTFISSSFIDTDGKHLGNLSEAYSNYKDLINSNSVKIMEATVTKILRPQQ